MTNANAHVDDVHDLIRKLPDLVASDPVLLRRGRTLTIDILLEIGPANYVVSIEAGRITGLERIDRVMRSWAFAVRGSERAWSRFWERLPPPHFHDLLALAKCGEFRIEGDLHPFMANLLYFKGLLMAPRRLAGEPH